MTWQGVSEAECYDNRSVIAQIVRIKDRLTAVEQNVDPTLRTDLEAAIAELTALENTVGNVETQVEANTGDIAQLQANVGQLQTDVGEIDTDLAGKADSATVDAALALKANATDVDADLELKADKTQLTDGSVTKLGTVNVGSSSKYMYLVNGVPTEGSAVPGLSKTNTFSQVNTFEGGIRHAYRAWTASSGAGKWLKLFYPEDVKTGAMIRVIVVMPMLATAARKIAILDVTILESVSAGQINSPGYTRIFTDKSSTVEAVATTNDPTGGGLVVYVRIPTDIETSSNANRIRVSVMDMRTSDTTDVDLNMDIQTSPAQYENIVYNNMNIPNITNYTNYTWIPLVAGQGIITDGSYSTSTSMTYDTY